MPGHRRDAERVMDGRWGKFCVDRIAYARQPVPFGGQFPDLIVSQPAETVQPSAVFMVDLMQIKHPVCRVRIVPENEARPVLARVGALANPVHFDGLLRNMIVLHNHDGFGGIAISQNTCDVRRKQKITIAEHGPAVV